MRRFFSDLEQERVVGVRPYWRLRKGWGLEEELAQKLRLGDYVFENFFC